MAWLHESRHVSLTVRPRLRLLTARGISYRSGDQLLSKHFFLKGEEAILTFCTYHQK